MRNLVSLLMLCLLTGCAEHQIDKVGLTDTVALDLAYDKDGKPSKSQLSIAVSIPKVGGLTGRTVDILQTTASSPKEARTIFTRQSDKPLVIGQLRCVLIGKELAKSGIFKLLDSYRRDSAVGERLKIVIVDGSSIELLKKKYPHNDLIGTKIFRMLEQQTKIYETPNVTLYSFVRDYYDDSVDPVAPLIVVKKDDVEMNGTALFDKDRYIGSIPAEQAILLEMLRHRVNNATLNVNYTDSSSGTKEQVLINSIKCKREIKILPPNPGNDTPNVSIHVKLDGSILEYSGSNTFATKEERLALNEDVSKAIQAEFEGVIRQVQRTGADNIGIGTYVQNHLGYTKWKALDWQALFPKADIQVEVETHIRDYGMIR